MNKRVGSFYEFFAGAGMARAGLGKKWSCLFANDFDQKKAETYRRNWKSGDLLNGNFLCRDIRELSAHDLPDQADLAWASFPCQDLSLAGGGAGLKGERSGTFWPFWDLMSQLRSMDRAPGIVVLENVCGTLSSHRGKDFAAICKTFEKNSYRFGAVVIDAALFVPQSRPRLFVIGIHKNADIPDELISDLPSPTFHTRTLKTAYEKLPKSSKDSWVWWNLKKPMPRKRGFSDLIEENPTGVKWHTAEETDKLLSMMSELNLKKVKQAQQAKHRVVGTVYKRTRIDEFGQKVQRAEIRFDNIAGCLRTPAGGSSRQLVVVIDGKKIRSRLISPRETARLMGLPESYKMPSNYNEAYHLTGDGVAVPVVRFLANQILEPLLACNEKVTVAA